MLESSLFPLVNLDQIADLFRESLRHGPNFTVSKETRQGSGEVKADSLV